MDEEALEAVKEALKSRSLALTYPMVDEHWTDMALAAIAAIPSPWRPIESAPRDGTEFLSAGGVNAHKGKSYPTRYLGPGPYSTENGKNTEGERRYQWPDGFYWAGYDGFVGPIDPTHWQPMPEFTPPEGAE